MRGSIRLAHLYTDERSRAAWVEQLQQQPVAFTVCAEDSTAAYHPSDQHPTSHYRIGFANLTEDGPFYVDVRRGLERAAQQAGNIDLIIADNQIERRDGAGGGGGVFDAEIWIW